jgi:hypothetical protein
MGTDIAEAEMERNESIAPPIERSEGIDHALSLLTKLVMFVDVTGDTAGSLTERSHYIHAEEEEASA